MGKVHNQRDHNLHLDIAKAKLHEASKVPNSTLLVCGFQNTIKLSAQMW